MLRLSASFGHPDLGSPETDLIVNALNSRTLAAEVQCDRAISSI